MVREACRLFSPPVDLYLFENFGLSLGRPLQLILQLVPLILKLADELGHLQSFTHINR